MQNPALIERPRDRAFDVALAALVACVFAAHCLRAWDGRYPIPTIALAAVYDPLFYLVLKRICRPGSPKPKDLPEKRDDGFDAWLA